jgi:hypothetical protein
MLKRRFYLLTSFLVFSSFIAQAQNPFLAVLGNGAGLEERLLYKKEAGPYIVTIDGTRLIRDDNYFKLEVLEDGQVIPADSVVTVSITPPEGIGTPSDFVAKYDGKRFVIDPLPLQGKGEWTDNDTWLVNVNIKTSAGEGATEFGMQVYPIKPKASFGFRAVNVAIPIVTLLGFMAVFALRGVRLEQAAT